MRRKIKLYDFILESSVGVDQIKVRKGWENNPKIRVNLRN